MSLSQNHHDLEQFCTDFELISSSIGNHHLTCLTLIQYVNAACSKSCANSKNNTADIKLDNITITSGYSQMTEKHSEFISGQYVNFNFFFKVSLYNKCYHNIIYETLNFSVSQL